MRTGRSDYDTLFRVTSIPADEPRFVVRAQDYNSGDTVRAWSELARSKGADPALIENALRLADAMDRWPTKKLPDADFLPEDQAAQLRFALERRDWNGGELTPTAIAERRGRHQVLVLFELLLDGLETAPGGGFSYMPPPEGMDPLAVLAELVTDALDGSPRPPRPPYVEHLERQLKIARAQTDVSLRAALVGLVQFAPANWNDGEDPEQQRAWRTAINLLQGEAAGA